MRPAKLTELGFQPGPVDGSLGNRTVLAARNFAANAGVVMEPLTTDNSDDWCEALTAFAQRPDAGDISHFDLVSEPEGVLSPRKQRQLWNAYKSSKQCLEKVYVIAPTAPLAVTALTADTLHDSEWHSPFTDAVGALACTVNRPLRRIPAPVPVVTLDERYGERQDGIERAATWFRHVAIYVRMRGNAEYSTLLRQALVQWAEAKSLGKGINVSWDTKPVDYQMIATIMSLLSATATVAADITPEERSVIGPWLNDLVQRVGESRWGQRQDNKQYMRNYTVLLWALMTGEDDSIQTVIDEYKLAIHDMRPDGSWPVDSQRGGMGLHYSSLATSHLVLTAFALKTARNIDLFDYAVDGRSVHSAVDWIACSLDDPGAVNSVYAIACPDSGDRFGTVAEPSVYYSEVADYLIAYADAFPDRESSRLIRDYYRYRAIAVLDQEANGGSGACFFATPVN